MINGGNLSSNVKRDIAMLVFMLISLMNGIFLIRGIM